MIDARCSSQIPRLAPILVLGVSTWAAAATPAVDVRIHPEVAAAHVEAGSDGSSTLRWSSSWSHLYQPDHDPLSYEALCGPGELRDVDVVFADRTVVVHCRQDSYMPVEKSVVLRPGQAPWSRPAKLRPEGGGHLLASDGSALWDPSGERVWVREPGHTLVASDLSPAGEGALGYLRGSQVVVESVTPAGETRWMTALPVTFDPNNDRFRNGPASIKTTDLQLVAGPAGEVAVQYARYDFLGEHYAEVMLLAADGGLVAREPLGYTEAPLRYLPEQELVVASDARGVRVLDVRSGGLQTHPVGVATVDVDPSGEHLSIRTADYVAVLATPDLRDQTTWKAVLTRSAAKEDRVSLRDGRLVIVGQGRVRAWKLEPVVTPTPADPQQAITAIRDAVSRATPGPARSQVVREWHQREFTEAVRACQADPDASGPCTAALYAWAEADRVRHAISQTPAGQTALPCPTKTSLQNCLSATIGTGVLVDIPDGFAFLAHASAPQVRVVTGLASPAGVVAIRDEIVTSDALHHTLAKVKAPRTGIGRLWQSSASSDRLFLRTVDQRLTWISPVHQGAMVVCDTEPRIAPLGALIEVSLDGSGYHPEQTAQHTVYTYASPCEGLVIGRGVSGVRPGPRTLPNSTQTTDNTCHHDCERVLTAPGRRLVLPFVEGMSRITALGDLNGDGIDDYDVWGANKASYWRHLYLSSPTSWTAVATNGGDT